ncbi:uncharacterized protein DUF3857 [Nonlabens dokdonensis]|jgi:mRNA-degrading endonuclease YafQ of YafQ-DinJ toxin-antitoxin module|uniref:DUF3857 domain-containing protein n=2 Tax=Nonlabens dokdonensis TaxID=328515 RepID=L7WAW9_NONDD|nr:DUF3857 domain-containing protein [Nonlabens dokdonensis]AGC77036.1 hypothetical protein DDD_1909 [Nonlabens dokdonensis DSW-6]PZX40998.1 uncharacterized protein DUF3857 [Nonlabens dokdonensis]
MKKLIFIGILLFSINSFGQDIKFGKVSKEDFNLTANDSLDHDALFIYRNVDINFTYVTGSGFNQNRNVHERILIKNEEGLRYATKRIRLWDKNSKTRELLRNLKGATYNLVDGKVKKSKLRRSGEFEEDLNERWKLESFTMPDVRIGSIIEYKYYIDSPFPSIDDIDLQQSVPTLQQDIKVQLVEYYLYNVLFNPRANYVPQFSEEIKRKNIAMGNNAQRVTTSDRLLTLSKKNIPALEAEPMSGNLENFRARMIIELAGTRFPNSTIENFSTSWEAVSKNILDNKNFGDQIKQRKHFKEDLIRAIKPGMSDEEKISVVFNLVKSKIKWDGNYGKFAYQGIKKAYKEGNGNVADVNLTIVAMLQELGFNANPVLVSSRSNGIPIVPTQDGFNYVIAAVNVDGNEVLLDATEPYSAPNLLPFRATNWQGRLIVEGGASSWVELSTPILSSEIKIMEVDIEEDFTLRGKVQQKETGHIAYKTRNEYAGSNEKNISQHFIGNNQNLEVTNVEVKELNTPSEAIISSYEFKYKDGVDNIGDKIYITPMLYEATDENPFKREERNLPVDLVYPFKTNALININIPDGYKVESLPESKKLVYEENTGYYSFIVEQKGNVISVRGTFKMNETLVMPYNYGIWRQFFITIVDTNAEKIVLTKI